MFRLAVETWDKYTLLKSQVETRLLVTLSAHTGLDADMVLAGNLRDFLFARGVESFDTCSGICK